MCSTPKSVIAIKAPSPVPLSDLNNINFRASFRQSNENVERLHQQRIREFESKEPVYQHQIEVDHVRCPSHLIQFKRSLKKLEDNQTLKISSRSIALINDLAA